jgi:hypothetical protein
MVAETATHPELVRLLQYHRVLGHPNFRASSRNDLPRQAIARRALSTTVFFHASLPQLIPKAHRTGIELLLNMGDQQLDRNLILKPWYDLV